MKIGPKYKIARRLGAAVFEKTQTAKFTLSEQKKKPKKWSRSRTNYATQLLEKQKVRFSYGLTEKQLRKYVKEVIESNSKNPAEDIYANLEKRLDSIILRSGLAKTRFQARQAASHGHFRVNGKKVTVPSMKISEKDIITLSESKKESPLYITFAEAFKEITVPAWISVDPKTYTLQLKSNPAYSSTEFPFDLLALLQFYKR
jgi:small subunit ribosomal protein S4